MIDGAGLMQRGHHLAVSLAEMYEPRADFQFCCCWYDELEAMSELLVDDDRTGKQAALAIDL